MAETPADPDLTAFAEAAIVEDEALLAARERAEDLGAPTVTPAVGATLAMLARAVDAHAVVEIGTGGGVSGLWLLSGMTDGVLTSIDAEAEHHAAARQSFTAAGIPARRARLINGRAREVLPRLSEASYDLIFIDSRPLDQPDYVVAALRLLRPGGILIVHNTGADGGAADPKRRDPGSLAAREAARIVAEDESLLPVVLPLGKGLLVAAKAPADPNA